MSNAMKVRLFTATVESVYLYGSETWTLTLKTEKDLNGSYTRMLRMALGVSWKHKIPNNILYGDLPKLTDKSTAALFGPPNLYRTSPSWSQYNVASHPRSWDYKR